MSKLPFSKTAAGAIAVQEDRLKNYRESISIHHLSAYDTVAKIALGMIERWGSVAGMPDGEDSSGRSKLRLATPQELVDRAFECAVAAHGKAVELGLVIELPEPELKGEGDK